MKPVRMIVAGTANPHVMGYLRRADQEISLVFDAVADFNQQRLSQAKEVLKGHKTQYYTDWREMLDAHPEADAMMIGSDNKHHFEMFQEAIKRNLHIYSMKVASMDEDECREMQKLAANYDRVIQVEFELHFSPQFRYARKLIERGELGEIQSIYFTNISQSPINYFPDWGNPELSYGKIIPIRPGATIYRGGALTDHPHPYDMIRWITGREFKKVYAVSARNQRSHLQVEDHAAMTGELDNGVKFFINPSYANLEEKVPARRLLWPKSLECNLKITGTKGYYAADYFDKHFYVVGNNHVSPNRLVVDGTGRTKLHAEDSMVGVFVACVRGERDRPESTLDDSIAAVKVMNAAYESIYTDSEVYVNK